MTNFRDPKIAYHDSSEIHEQGHFEPRKKEGWGWRDI